MSSCSPKKSRKYFPILFNTIYIDEQILHLGNKGKFKDNFEGILDGAGMKVQSRILTAHGRVILRVLTFFWLLYNEISDVS